MNAAEQVAEKLVYAAYMVGAPEMPDAILAETVRQLGRFPSTWVIGALDRCAIELKTQRLTISDITARFDDGRPGPEEAWAAVSGIDSNSDGSIVWTQEMATAWGVARGLIDAGEAVAARMAFLEAYKPLVSDARQHGQPAKWSVMPGSPSTMEAVIPDAVRFGRIDRNYAATLLAHMAPEELDALLTDKTKPQPRLVHDADAVVQQLALKLTRP